MARSSAETEFTVIAHEICEVLWIRRLLEGLRILCASPMKVYCDKKVAITIAHNPVLHDRTKPVEVDKYFIKEKLEKGLIRMPYLPITE